MFLAALQLRQLRLSACDVPRAAAGLMTGAGGTMSFSSAGGSFGQKHRCTDSLHRSFTVRHLVILSQDNTPPESVFLRNSHLFCIAWTPIKIILVTVAAFPSPLSTLLQAAVTDHPLFRFRNPNAPHHQALDAALAGLLQYFRTTFAEWPLAAPRRIRNGVSGMAGFVLFYSSEFQAADW